MTTDEEDFTVSISAVGEGLTALQIEYEMLERDIQTMLKRVGLAMQKQRVCVDTIKKILLNSGGVIPPSVQRYRFPELNHYDTY